MKKVLHIKSKVVENNLPKLPNYDQILYGEIAINYKDGYETLSIRNDADEVVTFSCDNSIIKLIRENSIVPSSGLTKINDNEVIVKLGDYLKFDQNSGITLVIDDELNSGSTNPISNSAITKVIYDNELVVSSALNDLEENKQNKLVAGNGISISDDVISYTGESQSVTAGSGVTITNGSVNVKLSDDLKFDSNSALSVNTDSQLSLTSNKPISNSAVTSALNAKQDAVTFESGLTANNGKVSVKLGSGLSFDTNSGITVNTDNALSTTSNNLVPNSVITNAINSKQNTLNMGSGVSIANDTINVKLGNGISFDANSALTVDSMTIDDELNIQSTNPVSNSAITQAILDNEEVTSSALNDLKETKQDKLTAGNGISIANNVVSYTGESQSLSAGSGITIDANDNISVKLGECLEFDENSGITLIIDDELDSGSTNPVSNSAITQVILDNEEVTSSALNDLKLTKQDVLTAGNGISIANNVVSYTGQSQSLNAGSGVSIVNDAINVKLGDGIAYDANSALTVNVSSQFVDATGDTMSGKLSITNGGIEVTGDSKINGTLSATTININDINGTNVNGTNVSGTTVKGNTISAGTYTNLPTASTTTFGVMKVGNGLNVTNGVVSVASVDGDYVNATGDTMSGKLSITNGGLDVSGNTNINGTLSATSINTPNLSITNVSGTTVKGSTVSATTYNNLPTATTTNFGVVKVGSGINVSNGTISVDDEYENVIETVKVNNATVTPDANKTINIEVPTSLSDLSDDATHRLVTDTEKSTWNGKVDKANAISALTLSLNTTDYKLTLSGTRADGTNFTVSDVVDLPLESVVVGGRYDAATKKVILTLQNGTTIDFSVADLVSGLQTEITSTNKLSADLIADGTTNKTVTASEKNTWNNKQDAITDLSDIRSGAALGVTALQSYTETDPVFVASPAHGITASNISAWNNKQDAISDLATIRSNASAGAAKVSNVQADWTATSGLALILHKPTLATVATSGKYSDLTGKPTNVSSFTNDANYVTSSSLATTLASYATTSAMNTALSGYLPLTGGTLTGRLITRDVGSSWANGFFPDYSAITFPAIDDIYYHPYLHGTSSDGSVWNLGGFQTRIGIYGYVANHDVSVNDPDWRTWWDTTDGYLIHTGRMRVGGQITSSVANGTAPLVIASSTLVSNLNADLLDGVHLTSLVRKYPQSNYDLNELGIEGSMYRLGIANTNAFANSNYGNVLVVGVRGADTCYQLGAPYGTQKLYFRTGSWYSDRGTIRTNPWKEIAFTDSNVTSATALETSRTLWGQNFDGSANVSGNMTGVGSIAASDDITVTKSDTSSARMKVTNGSGSVSLVASTPNRGIWDVTSSKWLIGTNGEKTFLGGGYVGINTTAPSYQLHVNGNTYASRYYIGSSNYLAGDSTWLYFIVDSATPLVAGSTYVRRGISDSNVTLGTSSYRWANVYSVSGNFSSNVVVSGDVTAKGAMYSSDRRLKENIEPISVEDINKLDNVDIVRFNFKSDEKKTTKYGVIAQDVEKAGLNNLVGEDENGSKSVDYISLLMLQIEKLNRKIDDMEKKHEQEVNELKKKIDVLSSKK